MAPSGRPSATARSSYEGAGAARSSRSSAWQPAGSSVNAPHGCKSRSARSSPASSGSSRSSGRSCAVNWSTGSTCPDLRSERRHSRRAVVASQPGSRSALLTASRFSSNRSQVLCTTSAESASGSRCARATDQGSTDKRATRHSQAAAPLARARGRRRRRTSAAACRCRPMRPVPRRARRVSRDAVWEMRHSSGAPVMGGSLPRLCAIQSKPAFAPGRLPDRCSRRTGRGRLARGAAAAASPARRLVLLAV